MKTTPPLAGQRRIGAERDALQAEVDALKRLQAGSRRGLRTPLDALLPAIRERAFTRLHPIPARQEGDW